MRPRCSCTRELLLAIRLPLFFGLVFQAAKFATCLCISFRQTGRIFLLHFLLKMMANALHMLARVDVDTRLRVGAPVFFYTPINFAAEVLPVFLPIPVSVVFVPCLATTRPQVSLTKLVVALCLHLF